jgi:hypothetical protein
MALKYELTAFEKFITENLKSLLVKGPGQHEIPEGRKFIHAEKERIKIEWLTAVMNSTHERQKGLYIQQHQLALTRLADEVYEYLLPKEPQSIYYVTNEHSIENLYKETYLCLDELLKFIREKFSDYFNYDIKIPNQQRELLQQSVRRKLRKLRNELKLQQVDDDLAKVICHPLEDVLLYENDVSYREDEYVREDLTPGPSPRSGEGSLNPHVLHLIYIRFNSIRFYNYIVRQIAIEASKKNIHEELVDYFSLQLKLLNQAAVKPGRLYYTSMLPCIKEQVCNWINEELRHLRKEQRSFIFPTTKDVQTDHLKKILVNLAVPDLFLGAELLLKEEVILNMKKTELVDRAIRNFQTKRQPNISEKSAWNNMHGFSNFTVKKMEDLLYRMLKRLREY